MSQHRGRIKGIFLDFDGTIVDSSDAYFEAARAACEEIGCVAFDRGSSLEIPKRLELQLPLEGVPSADVSRFLGVYLKKFYDSTIEKSRPFFKVDEVLFKLSQKARLALVTMRFISRNAVVRELRHFGLDRYFTYVATGLDTPRPKPSPEVLVRAAERLNVRLSDCVVVGDSISDVRAGKAAGIATVGVLSGLFSREELMLEMPDLILETVSELPHYVDFLK